MREGHRQAVADTEALIDGEDIAICARLARISRANTDRIWHNTTINGLRNFLSRASR